jgi:hypothetical protein
MYVGNSNAKPYIEGLVTSSVTPGGYDKATWEHCGGTRPDISDLVIVHDTTYNQWPFIGRVSDINKRGSTYSVTATRSSKDRTNTVNTIPGNPSHPSGRTSEKKYPAGTRFLTVLQEALTLTPDIFDGGITDPGLQFYAESNDLGGQSAEQWWNYISSLTYSLATPLLWHIRGQAGQQAVVIDFQDIAARYYVRVPEDQIDETYSMDSIVNEVGISYGNGQIAYAPADGIISHAILQNIRTLYRNAQNTIQRFSEAQALAETLLQRYSTLRSINDTITMRCEREIVRAVPPVYPSPIDNWPLWLVFSGYGIQLKDRPVGEIRDKYITGAEYNWDQGLLTARCGEVVSLSSDMQQIIDYNVNRLFNGPYNGPPGGTHPLADADLIPKVGPEIGSEVPPSTTYGIPGFKAAADGDEQNKYSKAIDPDLIADEGLSANINFDPSVSGFQAAIQVIPGTFNKYRLLIGDDTGLINDTVIAELHKVIPPSAGGGTQFLTTIRSNGIKDTGDQSISPAIVLGRGDFYMIKVVTVGTVVTWAALSLHAKKLQPSLKS